MMTILFDVNSEKLRTEFFHHQLSEAIVDLKESTPPSWGTMSAQHMIEHLVWAFRCSTGALELRCHTPEHLRDRTKRFLYDARPTPRCFKNPELGETPPPLEFSNLSDAQRALREEVILFCDHFRAYPKAIHTHPIFGPLSAEEWQRSHFKHCYHHLMQFGLIGHVDA